MAQQFPESGDRKVSARAPSALVLRSRGKRRADAPVDWSRWYVTEEEDMGESPEQGELIKLLRNCIDELARERQWQRVLVGSDAFFAWVPKHPRVQVSPDVYLLDNPPRRKKWPKSWQTWRPGVNPPRFAVEMVSVSWKKDYVDGPARYAQLGCRELVLFDPTAVSSQRHSTRHPLTVYRHQEDGAFALAEAGPGPVWSQELQAALVVLDGEDGPWLRIARDRNGKDLIPTTAERAEEETRRREEETRRREAAEQRLARMEAELARLKRRDR
jgi:Uma2 family endonuclease